MLKFLIAGLPQVTSSMVGAVPDLVAESDIGDIVDPGPQRCSQNASPAEFVKHQRLYPTARAPTQ